MFSPHVEDVVVVMHETREVIKACGLVGPQLTTD